MSVNNVSPSTFIGGTWEQIKDTFLLSAGDTYSAGSTGGSSTVTLTTEQIPSHTHSLGIMFNRKPAEYGTSYNWSPFGDVTGETHYGGTDAKGGGQAHNNMPPYLTVYVWKRTA